MVNPLEVLVKDPIFVGGQKESEPIGTEPPLSFSFTRKGSDIAFGDPDSLECPMGNPGGILRKGSDVVGLTRFQAFDESFHGVGYEGGRDQPGSGVALFDENLFRNPEPRPKRGFSAVIQKPALGSYLVSFDFGGKGLKVGNANLGFFIAHENREFPVGGEGETSPTWGQDGSSLQSEKVLGFAHDPCLGFSDRTVSGHESDQKNF